MGADWKTTALREFDAWSAGYDRSVLQRIFFRPSHDLLFDQLTNLPQPARVLDVGCGTGLFARKLLQRYPRATVVGLDLSPGMLEAATRNLEAFGSRVELVLGDSENLPFDDDQFDLVTCIHSFHHYPRQAEVMAQMYRVTRDGGWVTVVDANRDGWWGWVVFDGVVTAIEGGVHHCSAREFRQLYQQAGCGAIRQKTGGHVAPFLLTLGQVQKIAKPQRLAA